MAAECRPRNFEEAKHESASLAYRYVEQVHACTLLADSRSVRNQKTWTNLVPKSPPEDHATVGGGASGGASGPIEGQEGSTPSWRLDEYASPALFHIISPRSAIWGR